MFTTIDELQVYYNNLFKVNEKKIEKIRKKRDTYKNLSDYKKDLDVYINTIKSLRTEKIKALKALNDQRQS